MLHEHENNLYTLLSVDACLDMHFPWEWCVLLLKLELVSQMPLYNSYN